MALAVAQNLIGSSASAFKTYRAPQRHGELFDIIVTLLDRLHAQSPPDAQLDQDLIHARTLRGQHLRNHGNVADAQTDFLQAVAWAKRACAEAAGRGGVSRCAGRCHL